MNRYQVTGQIIKEGMKNLQSRVVSAESQAVAMKLFKGQMEAAPKVVKVIVTAAKKL